VFLVRFDSLAGEPEIGVARLSGQEFCVGRGSDCDFVIDRREISRRHCLFRREGEGWAIADLSSVNGTFVNDGLVGRDFKALTPGDRIRFNGQYFATFEADPDATSPGVSRAGKVAEDTATYYHAQAIDERFSKFEGKIEQLHEELRDFHQEMACLQSQTAKDLEALRSRQSEIECTIAGNALGDSAAIARIDRLEKKGKDFLSATLFGLAGILLIMGLLSLNHRDRQEIGRSFIDSMGGSAAIGQFAGVLLATALGLSTARSSKDNGLPAEHPGRDDRGSGDDRGGGRSFPNPPEERR
jgi:hypothetical protein